MAASSELRLEIGLVDRASKGLASIAGGLSTLGKIGGAALLGGAIAGVGALSAALVTGIGDAREAAKINAQTEQVILSMGNAAGVSATHVSDFAASLSAANGKSLFGDAQYQEASNLLLTFGQIKGTTLDLATTLTGDLAQALGGAPADQALMLGKALDNPTVGMGALRRVGLAFTAEQEEQVKALQASGDMMGAQGIIIAELNKQVGGSAEAAAKADGGMAMFRDRMGELAESVGAKVLPALNGLMGFLNSDGVQAGITGLVDGLVNGVTKIGEVIGSVVHGVQRIGDAFTDGGLEGAFSHIGSLVASVWPTVQAHLVTFGTGVLTWITTQVPIWGAQLLTWGQAFVDWIVPYIPIVLAKLGEFAAAAWAWIMEQAPILVAQFAAWGTALADWVTPYIPIVLGKLGELATSLWTWIVEQAPILLAQLQTWGESLIAWLPPQIPPLLAKAQELGQAFVAWIGEQAAPILAKLKVWADKLVEWIVPATKDFLAKWPIFLESFLDWIGGAAGPLLAKLGEWALTFVAWVLPAIPPFLLAVAGIAAALLIWVGETAIVLVQKLIEWGKAFGGWIAKDAIPLLVPALKGIIDTIGGWITGTAIPWAVSALVSVGSSLVAGIKSGISGAWDTFLGWIDDQIAKIPQVIRDALGIGSPSKVMAEKVGIPIVQGIKSGVEFELPSLEKQLIRLGEKIPVWMQQGVVKTAPALIEAVKQPPIQAVKELIRDVKVPSWLVGTTIVDHIIGGLGEKLPPMERAIKEPPIEAVKQLIRDVKVPAWALGGDIATTIIGGYVSKEPMLTEAIKEPPIAAVKELIRDVKLPAQGAGIGIVEDIVGGFVSQKPLLDGAVAGTVTSALAGAQQAVMVQGAGVVEAIKQVIRDYNSALNAIRQPDFSGRPTTVPGSGAPRAPGDLGNGGGYTNWQPEFSALSTSKGGESTNAGPITITINAQGSTTPARDIKAAVDRALKEAGLSADHRRRTA